MRASLAIAAMLFVPGIALAQTPTKYQIEHATGPCKRVLLNKELVPPSAFQAPSGKIYLKGPLVKFTINPDGTVSDVEMVSTSGSKQLDNKVLASISNWKYKPRPAQCGTIESEIIIRPDVLKSETDLDRRKTDN